MKIAIYYQFSGQMKWKYQQSWGLCCEHTFTSYYMSDTEVPINFPSFAKLNLLAVIASRGCECCGLVGVPEILEGTELSDKHSIISTFCCSLFKENPRLLKEFRKKRYPPEIFQETHFSFKDKLKIHRSAFWRNAIDFHSCIWRNILI